MGIAMGIAMDGVRFFSMSVFVNKAQANVAIEAMLEGNFDGFIGRFGSWTPATTLPFCVI